MSVISNATLSERYSISDDIATRCMGTAEGNCVVGGEVRTKSKKATKATPTITKSANANLRRRSRCLSYQPADRQAGDREPAQPRIDEDNEHKHDANGDADPD